MRTDNRQGPRVNNDIRVRDVRVIVESTGEQLGVIPTMQAIQMAQEQGLDLVEVSETSNPPVCKIMDYGVYKFRRAKALREAKKSQTKIEIKEMRFTPRIADHDVQVKARKIKEFLDDGNKVIISVKFKGREKTHMNLLGRELMDKVVGLLGADSISIENQPKVEGDNQMFMTISPKRN
jgi:translation initiation factor IF-3